MQNLHPISKLSAWSLLLVMMILLAACGKSTVRDPETSAKLVITTLVANGNSTAHYVLTLSGSTADATIEHPVSGSSYTGDLSPIVQLITGAAPADPSRYRTPESILALMSEHGWTIDQETNADVAPGGGSTRTIRTIRFTRPAG